MMSSEQKAWEEQLLAGLDQAHQEEVSAYLETLDSGKQQQLRSHQKLCSALSQLDGDRRVIGLRFLLQNGSLDLFGAKGYPIKPTFEKVATYLQTASNPLPLPRLVSKLTFFLIKHGAVHMRGFLERFDLDHLLRAFTTRVLHSLVLRENLAFNIPLCIDPEESAAPWGDVFKNRIRKCWLLSYIEFPQRARPTDEALSLSAQFNRFTDFNYRALYYLNLHDKDIGACLSCLQALEDMLRCYLTLFLNVDAAAPLEDLSRKATEAAILWNCRREIEMSLRQEMSLTPDDPLPAEVPLPPHTESILMAYDGEKTNRMIHNDLGSLDAIERAHVSAAELINILHQKGLAQGPERFEKLRQAGGRVITEISVAADGDHAGAGNVRSQRTNDFITFVDLRQSRQGGSIPFPVRVIVDAVTRNANIIPDSSRLKLIIYASELETHLDIKIGGHSARVHYSLAPPERGGRFALQYAEGGNEEGNLRRLEVMARAFRKAGLKVTVNGQLLEAVYDKDCGATALDAVREKAALGLQILNSMPDLDYALGGFNGTYADGAQAKLFGYFDSAAMEQIIEAWAQHCFENGFFYLDLLRPAKKGEDQFYLRSELYWDGRQGPHTDPYQQCLQKYRLVLDASLSESLQRIGRPLWGEFRDGRHPLGQAFFDRLIDLENRALRHSLLLISERGFVKVNPVIQELRQHPVNLFLEYLQTDDMLPILRQTALLASQVANLGSWEDIGKLGGLWVSRLRISEIKDVLSFFVLRVPETLEILLAFATVGEDPLPIPFIDRVAERIRPSNIITATDWIALILKLFGYRVESVPNQPHLTWDHICGYLAQPNPPDLDVGLGLIPGIVTSVGMVTGRFRANNEDRPPEDFKDGILVDHYLTPADDPKIQASRGVLITSGGELSHAAIRTREFQKPSLILKDVQYHNGMVTYVPHYNRRLMTCYPFSLRDIAVQACYCPPGNQDPITARDGELVRLDAHRGRLLILGDDQAMQQGYQLVLLLEKHPQMANLWQEMYRQLQNAENADAFLFLLSEWVLVQELPPERLHAVLEAARANPYHGQEVEEYLRHLLLDFTKRTDAFLRKQRLKIVRAGSLMELFYYLGSVVIRCERLRSLERLFAGETFKDNSARERLSQFSSLTAEKIQQYRPGLVDMLATAARSSRQEEAWTPKQALSWKKLLARAGDAGLTQEDHYLALAERMERFQSSKLERIRALQSFPKGTDAGARYLIAKAELDSDFRPLVGGKAAHSGEIVLALRGLGGQDICAPEGFATTIRLWEKIQQPDAGDVIAIIGDEVIQSLLGHLLAQLDHFKKLLEKRRLGMLAEHPVWHHFKACLTRQSAPVAEELQTEMDNFCHWLQDQKSVQSDALLRAFAFVYGRFAVRSSGLREDSHEESFAGQKLTVLNVLGPHRLCRAVADVLSSGAEAALVEEMVPAEVSGVAFSVHPRTGHFAEILVNTAYGLGEGVVSGRVDPDTLLLDKKTGRTLGQPILGRKLVRIVPASHASSRDGTTVLESVPVVLQKQLSLKEPQQLRLCAAVQVLEDHFDYPLDVEWAVDPLGRLFVLQSRPITTLRQTLASGREVMGIRT